MKASAGFMLLFAMWATAAAGWSHDEGDPGVGNLGMLSSKAKAGLSSPADGAQGVANPVTVSSNVQHYVQVTGPQAGAQVSIDSHLSVAMDGTQIGNAQGHTNYQVTLDANKQWTEGSSLSRESTVAEGQHYADASAWIQHTSMPGTRGSKIHLHGFTH